MGRMGKSIVVDASIARSAGETQHPVSSSCRHFLTTFLETDHKVVMTPDIREEWKKHRGKVALKWYSGMVARKRVDSLTSPEDIQDDHLRQSIDDMQKHGTSQAHIQAMQKDVRLLEAAFATDRIVISLDNTVRNHYSTCSTHIKRLTEIHWANPTIPSENMTQWLQDCCAHDTKHRLDFQRRL